MLIWAALASQAYAANAVPAGTPLPESDYTERPLCAPAGPGYASCLALELVPQTTAARERTHPLAMTLNHSIEPASAADGADGLRPQDLHDAYDLPDDSSLPQTIAVVDAYDDPTAEADLSVYDKEFGLSACTEGNGCFKKVNQKGESGSLPSSEAHWAGEIALDVETARAVCQNCKILLVEAGNPSDTALQAAEETAVRLGATEISNSYGSPETSISTDSSAYNHPGVVITASTGDDGYLNWSSSSSEYVGHPDYPATSPHVIAVGGTRLSIHEGSWQEETVWNDASTETPGLLGATGGGCSEHFDAQSWQSSVSDWSGVGCGAKRAAADVAADGDPVTGVAVYDSTLEYEGQQAWRTVGGTSLASPIVASTFALAGGSDGTSYPAQTLYDHLGQASLHDVRIGSNGKCTKGLNLNELSSGCTVGEEQAECSSELICTAATGYDGPSGVGTPDGLAAFAPEPKVTSVSPAEGPAGTAVTIAGVGLEGVTAVNFGDAKATDVVEKSPTELTAVSPEHLEGQVDVTVTTAGGTSASSTADKFTYLASPPTVTAVEPNTGSVGGGTDVTIKGTNLEGANRVEFGGVQASTVLERSSTELTVESPAHAAGQVDVTVTTAGGVSATSSADDFTYLSDPLPAIAKIEPAEGATAGGTTVTITGEYLSGATAVEFAGTPASDLVEESPTKLTAVSPAHTAGTVDVTVTTSAGASATGSADRFSYVAAPVNSSPPTVSGQPYEGHTLTAGNGEWEGNPTAYTYQWLRCNATGAACGKIPRATTGTHTLTSEDVDHTIEVEVTAEAVGGRTSATSTATPLVAAKPTDAFTWSGATASSVAGATEWSQSTNWQGGAAPSGAVGTLSFPSLSGDTVCNSPASDACYISQNTISGLEAEKLSIDDASEYILYGDPITLGAGGIEADTAETSSVNAPALDLPIALGASQTWSLTGAGRIGGELYAPGQISGEDDALTVDVSNDYGLTLAPHPDDELGAVTVEGANPSETGTTAGQNGFLFLSSPEKSGEAVTKLNATDGHPLHIDHAALLGAGSTGPLSIDAGSVVPGTPFPAEGEPFGTLTVDGSATLDPESSVSFYLGSSGTEPGVDETQLDATGNIDLAEAQLFIFGPSTCPHLSLGSVYTLVTTSGELTGTFANVPDGEKFALGFSCSLEKQKPTFEIHYTEHAVTATVVKPVPVNLVRPGIVGTPGVGGELTSSLGGWANEPTYASQWLLCNASGEACAEISEATGMFYSPTKAEVGHTLRLRVTATNAEGETSVTSPPTAVVEVVRPAVLVHPAIVGEAREGTRLFASEGSWEYEPTSYAYQWLRCDSTGANCSNIATNSYTYTLTSDDVGHTIELNVTAENEAGETSESSEPTGEVLPKAPTIATGKPPTIIGEAREGKTLEAHPGEWTPAASAPSYSYQWLRCQSGTCTPISGAVDPTYQLTPEDLGRTIEVEVTATNAGGSGTAHSAASSAVSGVEYGLTVTVSPSSGGSVTATPGPIANCSSGGGTCTGSYEEGKPVTLREQPEPGYTFAGWSGEGCSGTSSECTIPDVSAPSTVNAVWTANPTTTTPTQPTPPPSPTPTPTPAPITTPTPIVTLPGLPAPGTARVSAATARVKNGTAEIRLTCTGAGPCEGELKLTVKVTEKLKRHGTTKSRERTSNVAIATAGFSLVAGDSEIVHVNLNARGKTLLRKAGKHGLEAKMTGKALTSGTLLLKEVVKKRTRRG